MSKALTPAQAIRNDLSRMKDQFKAALPNHISVDKFIRTVQTAVLTSPQLVLASKQTLFASAMKAAQDGLLPDGKEAAIVTFKNKRGECMASYIPMTYGILKKVRNSGELSSITAHIVYKKDKFEFYVDENGEHINHRPNMFGDRGECVGVYALARTKDGAVYVEVLNREEIDAVKKSSKAKIGPWTGPFESEMIKKSAIKRLSKRLPMSTDLEFTMRADDDLYDFRDNSSGSNDPAPVKEKEKGAPNRLLNQIIEEAEDSAQEVYDVKEESTVELGDDEVPI